MGILKVIWKEMLKDTETGSHYDFLPLDQVIGLKRSGEVGEEAEIYNFFKNNFETLEGFIKKKYGHRTLQGLPKFVVLERKYERDCYQETNSSLEKYQKYVYKHIDFRRELLTGLVFGELTGANTNLLCWHYQEDLYSLSDDYPYGSVFGINDWHHTHISHNDKNQTVSENNVKIAETFNGVSEVKIEEMKKYLLQFSAQTMKSIEKYYENIENEKNNFKNNNIKGAQLLKELKRKR